MLHWGANQTKCCVAIGTFKVSLSGLCRGLCPGFCPAFCRPERASVPRSTVMTPLSRALSRDLLIGRSRCPVPTSWALSGRLSPSSSGSPTSTPPNSCPARVCSRCRHLAAQPHVCPLRAAWRVSCPRCLAQERVGGRRRTRLDRGPGYRRACVAYDVGDADHAQILWCAARLTFNAPALLR
jgi:hypothetical protein